ncbi:uncharacterized [Tachysurus ichikawai]
MCCDGRQEQAPEKPIMWPSENLSCRRKPFVRDCTNPYSQQIPIKLGSKQDVHAGKGHYSRPKKWLCCKIEIFQKAADAVARSDYPEEDRNVLE